MNTYDLKITVDADCDLYIDGEMKTHITRGTIYKNNLQEGEYIIQAKTGNPRIRFKEIINLDCNKVINISFTSIIQKSPVLLNKLKYHHYIDKDTSLQGYMDLESRAITIPAAFEATLPFNSYNIALVKYNGKYGFIDRSGNFIIPPHYDMYNFVLASKNKIMSYNDYCILSANGKGGIINHEGKWIIKPEEGYQIIEGNIHFGKTQFDNKVFFICKNSQELLTVHDGEKFLSNFIFNKLEFSDDRYIFSVNGEYGILNLNGHIFKSGFNRISKFNKFGYAWAEKNGTKGWIDKLGLFAYIPPTTFDAYGELTFNGKYGLVAKDNKVTYIDTEHNLLQPFIYDSASPFNEDIALVVKNGLFGLIDSSFKEICPCIYSTFQKPGPKCMSFPLAIVSKDNKFGCIDRNGTPTIPCMYKRIRVIRDNFIVVTTESDHEMIVNNYNKQISPLYDNILIHGRCPEYYSRDKFQPALSSWNSNPDAICKHSITGECAIRIKNIESGKDKYGIIDKECKEIVPPGNTTRPILMGQVYFVYDKENMKRVEILPDGKIIDITIQTD